MRRALREHLRQEILNPVADDGGDVDPVPSFESVPGVAEQVVDVVERDCHGYSFASSRSTSSRARSRSSNQYSRSSGAISVRTTRRYQSKSASPSAGGWQK